MKKIFLAVSIISATLFACDVSENEKKSDMKEISSSDASKFVKYNTPFETPTFSKISLEDYKPEILAAIQEQKNEIDAIVNNSDEPTFENTVAALDYTGSRLTNVTSVFFNLLSAESDDAMRELAKEFSPILSEHGDNISLNSELFKRIKTVYDNKSTLELNHEQEMLLDNTYKGFVRQGALLEGEDKEELKKINKELSALSLKFGNNILSETNKFKVFITDESELSGLPESAKSAAANAAKAEGKESQWLFTIHKPSLLPVLMYCDNRDLREKMFKGYINKGDHNDEFDNKESLVKVSNLRVRKANLLGYKTWADYILEENMAKKPENVYSLLNELMEAALPKAKEELASMQAIADKEGANIEVKAWDWWYYAEKVKMDKYAFDEGEVRPYFKLENVRDGAFEVATKLYGIKFIQRNDIDTYHKDVTVWEVQEEDGTHIGILYLDYFPRPGKRGGAWMNSFRKQYVDKNGNFITPLIANTCSFTPPNGDTPSLLSIDEVQTLFHEFGHGLHGLLSHGTYPSLTGTSVARDFVELPSQIMEHWSTHPDVLKSYAKHYQTGEVIPDELIEKMQNASKFNQGFATVEYISAALLDMDWHSLDAETSLTANEFENESMKKMAMMDEIVVRYRSTYFAHIFSGGYSSGYYAYIWAEILDADAFEAFKENGLFHEETAGKFREHVLSKGGSKDGMELYVKFRGKQPSTEALKKNRGLI
jgi:peptidyl-dipeptidase Dcp